MSFLTNPDHERRGISVEEQGKRKGVGILGMLFYFPIEKMQNNQELTQHVIPFQGIRWKFSPRSYQIQVLSTFSAEDHTQSVSLRTVPSLKLHK